MSRFPIKTSLAILFLAAILGSLGFVPGLEQYASFRNTAIAGVLDFKMRETAPPPPVIEVEPVKPVAHRKDRPGPPRPPITIGDVPGAEVAFQFLADRSNALRPFYDSLWRTENGEPGAVTRVMHFGDSPTTADQITADVRSLLQRRFGDAGHGFVLIAKPWAWYGHRGIDVSGKGWKIEAASQGRAKDGLHGVGGVSFTGERGATSRIRLEEDHDRVEVLFLRQPGGGTMEVTADGERLGEIATAGDSKEDGSAAFPLPAGATEIQLTVVNGSVRVFGWSFEKNGPGVRYDSLGLNGGQVQMVVRFFEPNHWTEEIRHLHPNLVVINYGTNESGFADYIEHSYAGELREVIRRVRKAAPDASVLIMSPMDRGERNRQGEIMTMPTLPKLVDVQRRIADETGCAFFDTFHAMGGEGTMGRWYEAHPRLVSADFIHPMPAGAKRVGTLVEEALYHGFTRYQRQIAQGLPARPAGSK